MEENHTVKKRKKGLTEFRRAVCLKLKNFGLFSSLLSGSKEFYSLSKFLTRRGDGPARRKRRKKFNELLTSIRDENFSDEILSIIFTPSEELLFLQKGMIIDHLKRIKIKELKDFFDQYWVDIRDFSDSKKPKFKNDIMDIIACKVLGMESVLSKQNKRKNEQLNIESAEFQNEYGGNCIFEMLGIQIPKDVMLEIFAYNFINIDRYEARGYLNSHSLVSVSWYLLTLECYGRWVKQFLITPLMIYSVPLIVLQNLRDVTCSPEKVYSKDIKYLMNNIPSVRTIKLSKNFQAYFNLLKPKPKTILKYLEVINIDDLIDKTRNKKFKPGEIKFPPAECVPKFHKFIVTYFGESYTIKINDTVKQIREIELRAPSDSFLIRRMRKSYTNFCSEYNLNFLSYFENLRSIKIEIKQFLPDLSICNGVFETFPKLSKLISIEVYGYSEKSKFIEMFESFPVLESIVDLKLDLRNQFYYAGEYSYADIHKLVKIVSSKLVNLKKFHFKVCTDNENVAYSESEWFDHNSILKVLNAFGHLRELIFDLKMNYHYLNESDKPKNFVKLVDFRRFWENFSLSFYECLEMFEFRCQVEFMNAKGGVDIGSQVVKTDDFLINGPEGKMYDYFFDESNILLNPKQRICFHFGDQLQEDKNMIGRRLFNQNGTSVCPYQWKSSKIVLSMSENDSLIVDSLKHFKDFITI